MWAFLFSVQQTRRPSNISGTWTRKGCHPATEIYVVGRLPRCSLLQPPLPTLWLSSALRQPLKGLHCSSLVTRLLPAKTSKCIVVSYPLICPHLSPRWLSTDASLSRGCNQLHALCLQVDHAPYARWTNRRSSMTITHTVSIATRVNATSLGCRRYVRL